jgi:hypothetical protein
MKRNLLLGFGVAAVCIFMMVLWVWDSSPPVDIPLPNPNGYDGLVQASQTVSKGRFDEMELSELEAHVRGSSNALQLARKALNLECRVPLEFTQASIESHMQELGPMKSLALAFAAEGRLAEMQNQQAKAARSHLDTIKLGIKFACGGVMIDALVALAIEGIGTKNLEAIVQDLDAKACREAAAELEALDASRLSLQGIILQEKNWARRTYPGLRYKLASLVMAKSTRKSQLQFEKKYNALVTKTRRLILDLAARAYELEKNSPLDDSSALVPDYLKAIPQDPLSGTNMIR